MNKPKIVFIYEHEYEDLWKDGLWFALNVLQDDYIVKKYNIYGDNYLPVEIDSADFVLGWGAFGSKVDKVVEHVKPKRGLCLGGNASVASVINRYDVIFYETEWIKNNYLNPTTSKLIHAFGINGDIYKKIKPSVSKIWDYLTVGAYSYWKRQTRLADLDGNKFSIGQIQKNNYTESFDIISSLLVGGVAVSNMLPPEELAKIYNLSKTLYIPADINGGGERAVLEARACGCKVMVENDNPKLKELLDSPIWDGYYYAKQLKKGIEVCLR